MKNLFYFLKTHGNWVKIFTILYLVIIYSNNSISAQSQSRVIVSGAGTAAVNGTYIYSRMINSRPCYKMSIYKVEYRDGGFGLEWEIWDTTEVNQNNEIKYFKASTSVTPPTGTWNVDVATFPAAIVSYIDVPVITTNTATSITSNSVISGGNITSDGGSSVTERGIVYSKTDTTPTIGEVDVVKVANGAGTGSFDVLVSSLTASTKYYVRAYAINAAGTAYGNKIHFTTTISTFLSNTSEEVLTLSPNPAHDGFYVNAGNKWVSLVIYDLKGNALISKSVKGKTYVDVNTLLSGMYIVKLGGNELKLIKN